jgi:CoA:oxalate CoA-transferase
MLEATLVTMGWQVSNWLIAGVRPQPLGNENMTAAPSGTFATGDGPLNIAANQQQQFENLVRLIGRPELVEDPRFSGRETRKHNRVVLKAEIETALARKPAAEWSALFNMHGIPAGEVLDVPAALAHPQVAARGLVKTFDATLGGTRSVAVVRSGFRLKSGDPAPAMPPPRLGADTDDVLAALGYEPHEIAALRRQQAI